MKNQKLAYSYAIASVILWSTVATAFKLTLSEIDVIELLLISSFTSLLVFLLLILLKGQATKLLLSSRKELLTSFIMGFLNPFFYYLILFKAYDLLPAQEAQSLNYTWGITVAIFGAIFLKEKISYQNYLGLLVSFVGVIVIATRGDVLVLEFSNVLGVSLALGSSIIWAAYWIFNVNDKRDTIIKLFWNFLFGTILIAFYALIFDDLEFTQYGIYGSIYIGIVEMGITFVLWLNAIKYSENAGKVSILIYLSPFISLLIINLFIGEEIYLSTFLGLIFIILGIIINRGKK